MTESIRVRMYNVGFGDAFLVRFPGPDREMKILVDCGSIAKGPFGVDRVVEQIIEDCTTDGVPHVDLVVATHRHRDHVSGFALPAWGKVHVGQVWMPWTEDPDDADAARIREAQHGLALRLSQRLALPFAHK